MTQSNFTLEDLKAGKQKIIVTGGAGLIGRPLAYYLADLGHDVHVMDDFSNSTNDLDKKVTTYECDMTDKKRTVDIITKLKPDIIYHLACHPYEGLSQFCPFDVSMTTFIATINALVGAVNAGTVKRFVNYSSMARYGPGHENDDGSTRGPPFQENFKPNPEDVYACAKVGAEKSAQILCDLHNIEYVNCVPHNVFGEANAMALSDPYRGFLLIWTNCLLRGNHFFIYGDGKQTRAPSYIGDCVGPMARLGFSPKVVGQTLNIGSLKEYDLNTISVMVIEEFEKITGRKAKEPVHVEDRPCEVKHAFCSIQKSVDLVGYEDKTTLREGINKLITWAAKDFPKGLPVRYLKEFEIEKKAPRVWRKRLM